MNRFFFETVVPRTRQAPSKIIFCLALVITCAAPIRPHLLHSFNLEANMIRFLITSLILAAAPAFADELSGTVIAFDRVDNVIVLDDRSVLTIPNPEIIPEGLIAGDTITVEFKSDGDNSYGAFVSIKKMWQFFCFFDLRPVLCKPRQAVVIFEPENPQVEPSRGTLRTFAAVSAKVR
jgi:hypothetical protein